MAGAKALVTALLLCTMGVGALSKVESQTAVNANPIRKVVMMLQNMQVSITAEGKKREEMYNKYMCYCQNGDEALEKSITDAEAKISQLQSSLGSGYAEKKQLEADVKDAQESRADAKE